MRDGRLGKGEIQIRDGGSRSFTTIVDDLGKIKLNDKLKPDPVNAAVQNFDLPGLHIALKDPENRNTLDHPKDGTIRTPLQNTCMGKQIEYIKALVDAGADVLGPDYSGLNPVHIACFMGDLETLEYFTDTIGNGDIDYIDCMMNSSTMYGESPLHFAVISRPNKNPLEIVNHLLDRGACLVIINESGKFAFDKCEHVETKEVLVEAAQEEWAREDAGEGRWTDTIELRTEFKGAWNVAY